MESKICPYLGRLDDAKTALDFPSEGNRCYRARPVAPVRRDHQAAYCLSGQHAECPVVQLRAAAPPPPTLAAPPMSLPARARKLLDTAMLPLALLLLYLAGSWIGGTQAVARMRALLAPQLNAAANDLIPLSGLFGQPPPLTMAAPGPTTRTPGPTPQPLVGSECHPPDGWVAYTIQPTDSLFRLSILFQTSVEALQKANCLGSQTALALGSTLYVPAPLLTATASASPTVPSAIIFTPLPPQPTSPPPTDSGGQAEAAPTRVPPTEAPPSANAPVNPDPPRQDQPPANPPQSDEKKEKSRDEDRDQDQDKDEKGDKDKGKDEDKDKDRGKDKDDEGGKGKNEDKDKGKGKGKGKDD